MFFQGIDLDTVTISGLERIAKASKIVLGQEEMECPVKDSERVWVCNSQATVPCQHVRSDARYYATF